MMNTIQETRARPDSNSSNYNHNQSCMMDTMQVIIRAYGCFFKRSRPLADPQIVIMNTYEMDHCRDSWLDEYLSSDHYTNSLITYDNDQESIEDCENGSPYSFSTVDLDHDRQYLPTFCGSDSPPMGALDIDTFHEKYKESMRFFDALYHERFYGMTSMLNEHLMSPQSTESWIDFSMQNSSWRKRILRSLEHDFELISVAQTCLLWEALHHQYQKVEDRLLLSENRVVVVFNTNTNTNISGKFQEFEIMLVRFMEDQKSVSCTHSFQSLLEVPQVTGYIGGDGGEAEVLMCIWKCIKAYWLYLNIIDDKKCVWKYEKGVEDPKDLELLHQVTKSLHKKKKMILLKGKKKCWLRLRRKAEDENRNVLFAKMDIMLVQRLLKMSMISQSHLNWCKHKLNNIQFRQGKLFRVPTFHVFPSSMV